MNVRIRVRGARRAIALAWAISMAGVAAPQVAHGQAGVQFSAQEKAAIQQHGPWPPPVPGFVLPQGSNPDAARALGEALFFDTRLASGGRVACASCHQPGQAFTDGLRRSRGLQEVTRNSPTLWNTGYQRWQGWDGGTDSLWAQTIRALVDPREMGSSATHIRQAFVREPDLACRYVQAFGQHPAKDDDETVMVHAAQAIGAFVATLVSPRTAFDEFRDALARGDRVRAARFPVPAQEGLRLFIGKGQCSLCHLGPMFSSGEFADIGLPFFSSPGVVDSGRYGGIDALKTSPYTRLSRWAGPQDSTTTRHVHQQPRNFGEFKVPSLRLVAQTAPYMHNGQLATLDEVIHHYDRMNPERLHAEGEQILRPLHLSSAEREQLKAFLVSLSSPAVTQWRPQRPLASDSSCRVQPRTPKPRSAPSASPH